MPLPGSPAPLERRGALSQPKPAFPDRVGDEALADTVCNVEARRVAATGQALVDSPHLRALPQAGLEHLPPKITTGVAVPASRWLDAADVRRSDAGPRRSVFQRRQLVAAQLLRQRRLKQGNRSPPIRSKDGCRPPGEFVACRLEQALHRPAGCAVHAAGAGRMEGQLSGACAGRARSSVSRASASRLRISDISRVISLMRAALSA